MNLGATIKKLRHQKGLQQYQLAELVCITPGYLSSIEDNYAEPTLATIRFIAEELDVPVPILFFLSLDQEDIRFEKLSAFRLIEPAVNAVISEFFNLNQYDKNNTPDSTGKGH